MSDTLAGSYLYKTLLKVSHSTIQLTLTRNSGTHICAHARGNMKQKLPKEISSLVNRKSHSLGVAYAEQTKQLLLTELDCMRSKGATLNDLEKYICNRPPPIFTA